MAFELEASWQNEQPGAALQLGRIKPEQSRAAGLACVIAAHAAFLGLMLRGWLETGTEQPPRIAATRLVVIDMPDQAARSEPTIAQPPAAAVSKQVIQSQLAPEWRQVVIKVPVAAAPQPIAAAPVAPAASASSSNAGQAAGAMGASSGYDPYAGAAVVQLPVAGSPAVIAAPPGPAIKAQPQVVMEPSISEALQRFARTRPDAHGTITLMAIAGAGGRLLSLKATYSSFDAATTRQLLTLLTRELRLNPGVQPGAALMLGPLDVR